MPLLSDKDSKIIRDFDILNTNATPGSRSYGIPFPGSYVVDSDGVIVAKDFEQNHRERVTLSSILIREFDIPGRGKRFTAETDHIILTVYASQDTVRPGNMITVTAEVSLKEKMHLYGPGVEGYEPTKLSLEPSSLYFADDVRYPKPVIKAMEVIDENVPIYETDLVIHHDLYINQGGALRKQLGDNWRFDLPVKFAYQACDDQVCYLPEVIELNIPLTAIDHDWEPALPKK